jgi:ATP-binding cassette, subfamily B, bacterial PglK
VDDVSISLSPGRMYGFVGETGSGKTTTMDLLLGLLEPSAGGVMVEGNPLGREESAAWRRRIGYVPQDIFLTDETVTNNIAFGVTPGEIDKGRVRFVAKLSLLDEVVEALPDGYDSPVGERGVRLSGGQRQRIGIARALYLEPEIIVFDEGTSALDPSTEAQFLDNLRGMDVTVLWVTHRLATIQRFDTIFVFHEGRLVGEGSHDDLLEGCSEYQRQVADQGS